MNVSQSLNQFQQLASVRVAAPSNQTGTYFNGALNTGVGATFTYATGVLTIDGVVVNFNDSVLLASQTLAYQNGIYQCIQEGTAGVAAILQRRGDFQCREQIQAGQYIPVSAGTSGAGSLWTLIEPLPAAIGVPQVSGANDIRFSFGGNVQEMAAVIQFVGRISTVAGALTYNIPIAGALTSDIVSSVILSNNSTNVYVLSGRVSSANNVQVVLSDDPGNGSNNLIATVIRLVPGS